MNPNSSSCRTLAFTLVEMLVVIAIIGILAAILLPVLNKSEARAKLIFCGHSQQQIGLAFHSFSHDHNGKFPMAISTNDGGSLEYVENGFSAGQNFYTSFRNFQSLSNELVLPQILVCPADTRTVTNNFASLQNQSLSYSVGVQSTFDKPLSILAGDRNIGGEIYPQMTIAYADQWKPHSVWFPGIHQFKGNMSFADGHVDEWNNSSFVTFESASTSNDILFLPTVISETLPIASGSPGSSGTSPGPGPASSDPSGTGPSSPSYPPSQPPPEQLVPSPGGQPGMHSSPSLQDRSSPAAEPAPFNPFGDRINQTVISSQTLAIVTVKTEVSGQATDAVVSVQDTNSPMSPFDNHMTMVMQNSLLWLYILLCILVLLYLLNKLRKKLIERRDREDQEGQS